jgi:hypothetical protein
VATKIQIAAPHYHHAVNSAGSPMSFRTDKNPESMNRLAVGFIISTRSLSMNKTKQMKQIKNGSWMESDREE